MKFIVVFSFFCCAVALNVDTQNRADSVAYLISDSVRINQQPDPADTGEQEESNFQDTVNSLFGGVDTFAWSNATINSGHFDSEKWPDTARIVLLDSLRGRGYCQPFKNGISCNFGERRWLWHRGVDIRLIKGDTVRAAFDGIVRVTKYDRRGYGNVVVVRHPGGLETIYGHLSKKLVVADQKVRAGDVVGLGGNTGHSTGSHLHFEMRYYGEPFDPNYIIDFTTYSLKCDTLVLTKANFAYLVELRKAKWMTIRKGDTLGHIAIRCHTTVKKLCELNHIKPGVILSIGRKLRYQ